MSRTRIPRNLLELKFTRKRHQTVPEQIWFRQILEDTKMRGKNWQEIEKEGL
jgi:hypothetical protein